MLWNSLAVQWYVCSVEIWASTWESFFLLPSGIKNSNNSPRSHSHLPWLQFSSSLWSMQSNTSSQRQRRGMQWARFRQRNSSSLHSFTQPTCQQRHTVNHQNCPFEHCCQLQSEETKTNYFLVAFCESCEAALTSSEPSRQLSCPSHRRLADTHPPLAHTYSFMEHEGATGRGQSISVNNLSFLSWKSLRWDFF